METETPGSNPGGDGGGQGQGQGVGREDVSMRGEGGAGASRREGGEEGLVLKGNFGRT